MDSDIKHHLTVGREFYKAGDYDRALPHLEAVQRSHDGFADVHNMLGVIYYQSGRGAEATQRFERALELNPRYTEAALNLSVCYNENGRYDEAKDVYARAAGGGNGGSPNEIENLDSFVKGKIANLHADVGSAYEAVGLRDRAVAEYRRALELCPTFVDIRTKLATTLRDMGDVDGAIAELTSIRDDAPEYIPARLHLGISLWTAKRVAEARAEWEFVLQRDPENKSCQVYMHLSDDLGNA